MGYSGLNLLPIALTIIPPTPFQYRLFGSVETNEFGQQVSSYGGWESAFGIIEPESEKVEHVDGTDITRKSMAVWIKGVRLKATYKQNSPDQIKYEDCIYNVTAVDDWHSYDGYVRCTVQEVMNT